jgi:hypothetical protein
MGADDPTRASEASEAVPAPGLAASGPAGARASRNGVWLTAVLAALAAGLAVGLAAVAGAFHVEPGQQMVNMMGVQYLSPTGETRTLAERREVAWSLGAFGLLLGAGLGMAGAWPSRSWRRALAAIAVGGLLGAAAGALMPRLVLPWYDRAEVTGAGDLTRSLQMHLGLWGLIGTAAGLGFGIGRAEQPWRWALAVFGGAVGAVIGVILYDVLGATLFPLAGTGKPISDSWATRLMAFLLVALMTAAATVVITDVEMPVGRPRKAAPPATPPAS